MDGESKKKRRYTTDEEPKEGSMETLIWTLELSTLPVVDVSLPSVQLTPSH